MFRKLLLCYGNGVKVLGQIESNVPEYGCSEVQPSETAYSVLSEAKPEPECNVPKGWRELRRGRRYFLSAVNRMNLQQNR